MRCWAVFLCSLAGVSFANDAQLVVLESLRFSSYEAYTIEVETGGGNQLAICPLHIARCSTAGIVLQIKGTITRPAQVLEVEEKSYVNLDLLIANVQTDYCQAEYVPAGESEFNAGRNITASMGDYVPAQLRIEISYHVSSSHHVRSATRRTSLVCPNSMRE